ncbi:MAG: hypothetical protein LBI73_09885 [Myroides sp.]|jgi:hypothetical protein|nr:hypothetical protein [Myroides sp.]
MKTLSTDQIQALHTFVKKHYVEYYDIELELVDHLANGIEAQWIEDSTITFEIALEREFKKFGIFGFSDVVDNKTSTLYNHYIKLIFQKIVEFLHWPKIILTGGIYYILYLAIEYLSLTVDTEDITSTFTWSALIIAASYMVIESTRIKRENKRTNTKWLMDRVLLSIVAFPITGFYLLYVILKRLSSYSIASATLCGLFIGLWIYITYFVILPQLKEEKDKRRKEILHA